MARRSWICMMMGLIRSEQSELSALEYERNCYTGLCMHSSIYKYK